MIGISYRRDDVADTVYRLYDRLVHAYGIDGVFLDQESIQPGVDFFDRIVEAFSACSALLVIVGPEWAGDRDQTSRILDEKDYVRREVEYAISQGKPVIPVMVDGGPLPAEGELPESLRILHSKHHFQLRSGAGFYDSANALVQSLDEIVGRVRSPIVHGSDEQLKALAGTWKSWSNSGVQGSVCEEIEAEFSLGKICFNNAHATTCLDYRAEGSWLQGNFVGGDWWSLREGSTVAGVFLFKVSPHKECLYGYYTGFTFEGASKLLAWCMGRRDEDLATARRLAMNLFNPSDEDGAPISI